jgi:hypothetical protein
VQSEPNLTQTEAFFAYFCEIPVSDALPGRIKGCGKLVKGHTTSSTSFGDIIGPLQRHNA